jgi:transcriptional regulator with XRE-family HTH domain
MPTLTEERVKEEMCDLGARIRSLRMRRGWTQDDLGARSGLSKSYLSRLEEGDRQPSVAALLSIANAFGMSVNQLFERYQESASCGIVRASIDPLLQGNGLFYRPLLSGDRQSNIQPIRITVPAGRSGDELYQHAGEEWLYVLTGALCLTLGLEVHNLYEGDAVHFDAGLPHRLTALGGCAAEIILVACALPRPLLSSYL